MKMITGFDVPPIRYFEEISAIPRASGNEAGMADYLMDFAATHGLEATRDAVHNVFIRRPGSVGRENEPALLLQAHTDMVAEKHSHVVHDFAKDPIRLIQEGSILHADGTTLGADDGFGVAVILGLLAEKDLSTPPLECLFTVSEETGMIGAGNFDYGRITARRMLNLDSAEEDTVIIGCCGGLRSELTLPVTEAPADGDAIRIQLAGLCGGHSGEDIHRGRRNAHILMGEILQSLLDCRDFRLSYISGGDKDNAIPRECEAVIVTPHSELLLAELSRLEASIKTRVTAVEDGGITLSHAVEPATVTLTAKDTAAVLRILSLRNGVLYMRTEPPIMPETSRNLARIRTEQGKISIGFSSRSNKPAHIEESQTELDNVAEALGGSVYHHSAYPGWVSPADSELVLCWQKAYREATGKETSPTLIHAGLECGLISAKLEGLSAISVGCNVKDLHTPAESMELDSLVRIWQTAVLFVKSC